MKDASFCHVDHRLVGRVWLAASERGLCRVHFGGSADEFEALATRDGMVFRGKATARWLERARSEILQYLDGKRRTFSVALDPPAMSPFARKVLGVLAGVPYGRVVTYGRLAEMAGRAGAARAVGMVMSKNPIPIVWPCHRVVSVSGLGGFSAGLSVKRRLLELEGAT